MDHLAGVARTRATTPILPSPGSLPRAPFFADPLKPPRGRFRDGVGPGLPARHGDLRHAERAGQVGLREPESFANPGQLVSRHVRTVTRRYPPWQRLSSPCRDSSRSWGARTTLSVSFALYPHPRIARIRSTAVMRTSPPMASLAFVSVGSGSTAFAH